jgi:hypothetical protein
MRKFVIYFLGAVVLVAGLAVVWYLASPLFINRTVDEAFPIEVPPVEELEEMSAEEIVELESDFMESLPPAEEIADMSETEQEALEETAMQIATVMPEKQMDEPMPTTASEPTKLAASEVPATPSLEPTATSPPEPVLVNQGSFYGADDFHQGSGKALIYQIGENEYFLRLEDFNVTNGPQLHVIFGVDDNPYNHATLGDYLDLGPLKGNIGDQNYEIPAGTDLDAYGSVVIYCVPFRAIFAIAPLK